MFGLTLSLCLVLFLAIYDISKTDTLNHCYISLPFFSCLLLDVRWKNKFWGKSMEIVPMGTTNVTLPA